MTSESCTRSAIHGFSPLRQSQNVAVIVFCHVLSNYIRTWMSYSIKAILPGQLWLCSGSFGANYFHLSPSTRCPWFCMYLCFRSRSPLCSRKPTGNVTNKTYRYMWYFLIRIRFSSTFLFHLNFFISVPVIVIFKKKQNYFVFKLVFPEFEGKNGYSKC